MRCHLEHNGLDFQLIHWRPSRQQFEHRETGYRLEGKHAGLECTQCHTPKNMLASDKALIQRKDLTKSFFGLSQVCQSCHQDPHKGQLGADCQHCHNPTDFKSAKLMDHSKTRFPLTGQHAQVACEKCHKPDTAGEPARFRGIKFGACSDCHIDPHRGSFAPKRCEECHRTTGFKKLLSTFSFDHSKTKFPLEGKHQAVACASCHINGNFKKQLAFGQCTNCHKDEHNGQFASREKKGECSECHTVRGWKPPLFGIKDHARSAFPLDGKHAKVECAKCHIPAGKQTVYKLKFANCTDCHKDEHDGQFAGPPYNNRCESCHTVKDFHRLLFTIAQHQKTRFILTGAHTAVACNDCHKAGMTHRPDKIVPFRFEDRSCMACHEDRHHGQFKERMARRREDGTVLGCEACHNTASWTQVANFDHGKTSFPLLGMHRAVACGACHKALPGAKEIRFKGTPQKCQDCHADPHGRQFNGKADKPPCADCHNPQRWVPSLFDHDKRTQFPLRGGHSGVKCEQCHTMTREVAGKDVRFYKPAPVQCSGCHGSEPGPLRPPA